MMMCGSFYGSSLKNITLEWNAICDPHATEIVYHTPIQKHYSVGLDVTQKVTMSPAEFREKFSRGQLSQVLDYAEIWLQKRDLITFHDPLAAAAIFEPDIVKFEQGIVNVDLENKRTMGLTDFTGGGWTTFCCDRYECGCVFSPLLFEILKQTKKKPKFIIDIF